MGIARFVLTDEWHIPPISCREPLQDCPLTEVVRIYSSSASFSPVPLPLVVVPNDNDVVDEPLSDRHARRCGRHIGQAVRLIDGLLSHV